MHEQINESTASAVEAFRRGFVPVPLRHKSKAPRGAGWQNVAWTSEEEVIEHFEQSVAEGSDGVGLVLGKPSSNLVDVDLDSDLALSLAPYFLPPTAMKHGRASNRQSHRWYRVTGEMPGLRRYVLSDGAVAVEFRTTGGQTVIPPSVHPSGEDYFWEGEPFGGDAGPAQVDGRQLAVQVALLGLGAVLLEGWPEQGGRHDAYLALVGGLLRFGDDVHPFWKDNVIPLIEAIAEATEDEDGAQSRVSETYHTTVRRLREGKTAAGFPRLGEIIGAEVAEAARRRALEVESLAGFVASEYVEKGSSGPVVDAHATLGLGEEAADAPSEDAESGDSETSGENPLGRNPMEERLTSWDAIDLEPYLTGKIVTEPPSILTRDDGVSLFYGGKVNMIFGPSESAKSWITQWSTIQHMRRGERVVYVDMEDGPAETVKRLRLLGALDDELKDLFTYVRPEDPLAAMQRNKFGNEVNSTEAMTAESAFRQMLATVDPTLIVVDGMTAVYSLHGLDTNDSVGTEVINKWLKSLTRAGRTGVVVIDHTTKGGGAGSAPIGSQHKVSMVSGSSIRADAVIRPVPGRLGQIDLRVFKDRPGQVRQHSVGAAHDREPLVARVKMDSSVEDRVDIVLEAPPTDTIVLPADLVTPEAQERITRLEANTKKVLAFMHKNPYELVTTGDVIEATGLTQAAVYDVWKTLKSRGDMEQEGQRRGAKYRLTEKAILEASENE